jgi:hypothetical protein
VIISAENFFDRDRFGLVLLQLFRPGETLFGVRAGAGVIVFGVSRGFFVFNLSPVVPTVGFDVIAISQLMYNTLRRDARGDPDPPAA